MVKVKINGKEGTIPRQSVVVDHKEKLRFVLGADDFIFYSFSTDGNSQGGNNYNTFSLQDANGGIVVNDANLISYSPESIPRQSFISCMNGGGTRITNGFAFTLKLPRLNATEFYLRLSCFNNPNRFYYANLSVSFADSGKIYYYPIATARNPTRSSTLCEFPRVSFDQAQEPVEGYRSVF